MSKDKDKVPGRVTEEEYMAAHQREVAESRYWQTYNVALRASVGLLLVASSDQVDMDLERAHRLAQAAAERAHGTLEEIRGMG